MVPESFVLVPATVSMVSMLVTGKAHNLYGFSVLYFLHNSVHLLHRLLNDFAFLASYIEVLQSGIVLRIFLDQTEYLLWFA